MTALPSEYLENMKFLLEDSYDEFLSCYLEEPVKGLRFNRLKAREDTVERLVADWRLEPVPWCETGYYYGGDIRPGLSPYHDAGVFYIQEPSAMSVCEEAGIEKRDIVLDLCAAPGGKSSRAAELCTALLSNEIIGKRARILSSNIERLGIGNAVVSQASPEELSKLFEDYFDDVICDVPCSGEGMMRKDETAISEWSYENVLACAKRQGQILECAQSMVKAGGKLIYSTCTFEPSENEDQIAAFTALHHEFHVVSMKRFWPHLSRGEGHFLCVLRKDGEPADEGTVKDRAHILDDMERRLAGGKAHILRKGILPGEHSRDRRGDVYVPSHAQIMASSFSEWRDGVDIVSERLLKAYMSGDVMRIEPLEAAIKGGEGYVGVFFDGYPLGLGKRLGNTVKNHLPKGLRRVLC